MASVLISAPLQTAPPRYDQHEEQQFRRALAQQFLIYHAESHQNGREDEINVAGLSGVLVDPQPVTAERNGATVASKPIINFVEGSNITLSVVDAGTKVSVTINGNAGTVTGSGTTGKLAKWTSGTALGNSLVSESGTVVTVTGSLVTTTTIQGTTITGTTALVSNGDVTAANQLVGTTLYLPHGAGGYTTNGQVWTTTSGIYARINGVTVGPLAAATAAGIGGSGTTGRIPKFSASTTLADSSVEDSGTIVNVNAALTVDRASYTADSGDYTVASVIVSTSAPSGTAPSGTLWAQY